MKLLNYFERIRKMPNKANKFDIRLQTVKHTIAMASNQPPESLTPSQNGAKMAIFLINYVLMSLLPAGGASGR